MYVLKASLAPGAHKTEMIAAFKQLDNNRQY